jgi:hypothetical protein
MTQYYIRKSKKVGVMWYNGKNIDEAREFIGNGDIRLEMQPNGVLAIKYRAGFTLSGNTLFIAKTRKEWICPLLCIF